ncbi:hypothetical protein FJK98_02265 [Micromonospora sp. HM134]|uniref:hypothetical protein n=1 Tax=Micromonospora sp. HM134 TaxID=2583243 RepID=UPI00119866A5|nr:hypothetical protein [Micromonospora sp. HM134]QDY06129.1 hypothetical protein FJK98_02265 [Micromonospora sp. HM134]
MTAPLTDTATSTSTSTDDDAVHVFCCDDNVAICGEVVLDVNWLDDDTPTTCPMCLLVEDMPCGNPDCPDRETEADWVDVG